MNKAIFFDRDGTIIVDKHYQYKPEEIEYLPGYFTAHKILQDLGFELFVITNQSGVGRGIFTLENVEIMHHQMQRDLINQGLKPFKEFKVCPHHPDDLCPCRKPNPQMAEELIKKYKIDRAQSYYLGDKKIDGEMAVNSGLKPVIIGKKIDPYPCFQSVLEFTQTL